MCRFGGTTEAYITIVDDEMAERSKFAGRFQLDPAASKGDGFCEHTAIQTQLRKKQMTFCETRVAGERGAVRGLLL